MRRAATESGEVRCSGELELAITGSQELARVGQLAVSERDRDLDHLAVAGEGLAGPFLEPLHRVHELELVVAVLLLEGGGIDPLPSLGPGPTLGPGLARIFPRLSRLAGGLPDPPPVAPGPAVVEQ